MYLYPILWVSTRLLDSHLKVYWYRPILYTTPKYKFNQHKLINGFIYITDKVYTFINENISEYRLTYKI